MGAKFWDKKHLGKPWAPLWYRQNQHLPSVLLVESSLTILESDPMLPWNSVIWGGYLDFCFNRFKAHWDNFYLNSWLFLQSKVSLHCVLAVLFLYHPKKVFLSLKVTMFLHYLWVGPLQTVAVTTLLWMEIGISCLAGMAILIILLPLKSCTGKLFSSLR